MREEEGFSVYLRGMGISEAGAARIVQTINTLISQNESKALYDILSDPGFEMLAKEWLLQNSQTVTFDNVGQMMALLRLYRTFIRQNGVAKPDIPVFSETKNKVALKERHQNQQKAATSEIPPPKEEFAAQRELRDTADEKDAEKEIREDLLHPNKALVLKTLKKQEESREYINECKVLRRLFCDLVPENRAFEDVLLKTTFVASGLNIPCFNTEDAALHIVASHIDGALKMGDEDIVDVIAPMLMNGKVRNEYTFAVKYCYCHNPERFPLFSADIERALRYFRDVDGFYRFANDELKNYPKYKRIVRIFREKNALDGLSIAQLTRYLHVVGRELKKG